MIIILGLVFSDQTKYLSFVSPQKLSYLILGLGLLVFIGKLIPYILKSLISNKSDKVRNSSGKASKSVSSKKID